MRPFVPFRRAPLPSLPSLLTLMALLVLLLAGAAPARADTAITLWKAFDGRVNFTGTQVSLRTRSNTVDACAVSSANTNRTAQLTLPIGATVLSAQLYWAGSGPADNTVTFEGKSVAAGRKYSSTTVGGGINFFSGVADVTAVVKAKGSGTYNFSGLTVSIGNPWCGSQAVLGGFSLLVVYSHPTEPERVLNVYEGFRYLQNSEIVFNASNFRWNRTAFPVREKARVGHITWEGDPTLGSDGERLLFEGDEVSDTLNPQGNQFNSRSNINNDSASYGIDFDAYDTSVVIWSYNDAQVTTSYRTGQDLVLLSAEVLVVPTLPISDLTIALTRGGVMQVGKNTVYTATVSNTGPYTEAGPITVTDTLPPGVSYVSASGSGWTCAAAAVTASGQLVTCTYTGAIAPDTSSVPLVLTAAVSSTGSKTSTVTVKGTDDDDATNNSASNTSTAAAADVSPMPTPAPGLDATYVFTDRECAAGVKIGSSPTACQYYTTPVAMTAGKPATVWITALNTSGVPATPPETPKMKFALRCVNPQKSAGVKASYGPAAATATLQPCMAQDQTPSSASAWSNELSVPFAAGKASVAYPFNYLDVGNVEMSLLVNGAVAANPAKLVSKPDALGFKRISNAADVTAPLATVTPDSPAFAMAGEELQVEIGARIYSATGQTLWAPNFGNEVERAAVLLGNEALYTDKTADNYLPKSLALAVDADSWTRGAGSMAASASWDEVGATRFVASLGSYLDAGAVTSATQDVGRFYPAYFSTEVTAPMICPPGVACADLDDGKIGAAFARQPFGVTVVPRNSKDEPLENYGGKWARPITLSAVDGRGPLAKALGPLTPGALPAGQLSGSPSFALPVPFAAAAPRAGNWTRPTTIYVRANAPDKLLAKDGSTADITTSSNRAPAESDEDGIVIINGRLKVANALGTDLLRTPVGLRAEYWPDAGGWLGSSTTAATTTVGLTPPLFPTCRGVDLAVAPPAGSPPNTPPACNGATVRPVADQTVALTRGLGALWLREIGRPASGKARAGSIDVQFPGWPWLPSTQGKVSFGSHRSPVIYVREMY